MNTSLCVDFQILNYLLTIKAIVTYAQFSNKSPEYVYFPNFFWGVHFLIFFIPSFLIISHYSSKTHLVIKLRAVNKYVFWKNTPSPPLLLCFGPVSCWWFWDITRVLLVRHTDVYSFAIDFHCCNACAWGQAVLHLNTIIVCWLILNAILQMSSLSDFMSAV